MQTSAIPVAAHALGLLPESVASAYTTLPLCRSDLAAAAFCAAFLTANAAMCVGMLYAHVAAAQATEPLEPRDSETLDT